MKKAARPTLSGSVCPPDMSLRRWQCALRRQAAEKGQFSVAMVNDRRVPGVYSVTSSQSRKTYRTIYHGQGNKWNVCECMDFRTNSLGTCKHLEAVGLWLAAKGMQPVTALPRNSALDIDYAAGRRLRLRIGAVRPDAMTMAAMRYFDDDMHAVAGMIAELPAFIEQARRIDPNFHSSSEALNYILEERDRLRRMEMADRLTDESLGALLKTDILSYQKEAIRFAFRAGRSLIADEMGLGKTVEAIGTAELLMHKNMVGSVLIVCPTSLKYQWKREIERFTGSEATVIEGLSNRRRALYDAPTPYRIVSYHTLANDIKALGSLRTDMLIMDEVQRLKNWNTQIAKAARRVESEYAVVLSGTPLENKLEELFSVMQFVDQYALGPLHEFVNATVVSDCGGKITGYRHLNDVGERLRRYMLRRRKCDVALELPERTDKILFVPMTREQRAVHDEALVAVAQLAAKWRKLSFLSEKDRKRLLQLLARMRMVCDSTYLLDQRSRCDTKVGEAVELVNTMIANDSGKAVIFSQWERMTRLIADELDRVGIGYAYLHGGVAPAKRGELCERFASDPDCRVFLSTDAGSTGLNLQSASTVIHLDLPWNPAVLEQRIARAHRMGQRRNVQVISLISAGTIEERMLTTLDFKRNVFAGVLDGGEDEITLDDSRLSSLANSVAELFGDAPSTVGEGSLIAAGDSETPPEAASESIPDPQELIQSGATFLGALARTLKSPEATRRFVDTIVRTDADGHTSITIPVESREAVESFLTALSRLF